MALFSKTTVEPMDPEIANTDFTVKVFTSIEPRLLKNPPLRRSQLRSPQLKSPHHYKKLTLSGPKTTCYANYYNYSATYSAACGYLLSWLRLAAWPLSNDCTRLNQ